MTQTSGPTAEGEWTVQELGPDTTVLVRPADSGGDERYCVASRHRVVVDDDDYPRLALTLVLQGVPEPDERDVTPRVRQGALTLTTTLNPPPEATGPGTAPLYVREGTTVLRGDPDRDLASEPVSGTGLTTTSSCTLDRDDTLAALAALDGTGSRLSLVSTLWYRAIEPATRSHLTGSWAEVYDVLEAQAGDGAPDLHRLFEDALASGALVADPADHPLSAYPSFAGMARAVLLDIDGRVGARPSPLFGIDIVATSTGSGVDRTLTVMTPLADVLGGALAGRDRGRVVSIVGVTADPGTTGDPLRVSRAVGAPRRVRGAPRGADVGAVRRPSLALMTDNSLASTDRMLTVAEANRGNLHLSLANKDPRPYTVGVHAAALNDQSDLAVGGADLPVVADTAAWVFQGRNGAPGWYAPSFEIVRPLPTQDASDSPFVYSFRRVGTALDGSPGLEASVTLTLRRVVGPEVRAVLDAGGPYRPVPTDDTEIVLDLPFRDASGTNQRQRFTAETGWDGEVLTARVSLLDAWARMAYGALSQAGFQVEPARVSVVWTFRGCEHVVIEPDTIVWGGKLSVLPIRYSPPKPTEPLRQPGPLVDPPRLVEAGGVGARVVEAGYLDATTATYRDATGDFTLRVRRDLPAEARTVPMLTIHAALARPNQTAIFENGLHKGRPDVTDGPRGGIDPPRFPPRPVERWMQRSYVRSQVLDLLMPCSELGSCYVEQRDDGPTAVGCQDALRLGQTAWRQYEEIPALADPAYKVYRSLQQPGHFLVLPARYVVGRYPDTHPTSPYQPAILLYALLDPADPGQNQVVVQATLAPDIAPFAWAALVARLEGLAPAPTLTLASDVECAPDFTWTVVGIPSVTAPTVLAPGVVSVALQSDLAHALLLRDMLTHDGILGTMTLRLPDGSRMTSSLQVGLSDLTGPAPRGPLELTTSSRTVTLVNRIERPVNLTALRVADGTGSVLVEVPVERPLLPGSSTTVEVADAETQDAALSPSRCWPVYKVPPRRTGHPPGAADVRRGHPDEHGLHGPRRPCQSWSEPAGPSGPARGRLRRPGGGDDRRPCQRVGVLRPAPDDVPGPATGEVPGDGDQDRRERRRQRLALLGRGRVGLPHQPHLGLAALT